MTSKVVIQQVKKEPMKIVKEVKKKSNTQNYTEIGSLGQEITDELNKQYKINKE